MEVASRFSEQTERLERIPPLPCFRWYACWNSLKFFSHRLNQQNLGNLGKRCVFSALLFPPEPTAFNIRRLNPCKQLVARYFGQRLAGAKVTFYTSRLPPEACLIQCSEDDWVHYCDFWDVCLNQSSALKNKHVYFQLHIRHCGSLFLYCLPLHSDPWLSPACFLFSHL